jgi:hypothetical protein
MSKIFSKKYLVTYEVTYVKRNHTDRHTTIVNGSLEKWFQEMDKEHKHVIIFAIAI